MLLKFDEHILYYQCVKIFLTYRLTQVLTRHGCFGRFLHIIGREETLWCHHCVDSPEYTMEHTVAVCPLGRNTAMSSWRLSMAPNSRFRPWCKTWSGARGNRKQSPSSAKQSCWRRRRRDVRGTRPLVPAAAGDTPDVGSRETTPGRRGRGPVDGEQ